MEKIEWNWNTSDGLKIYSCSWFPKGKPKAILILIHGLGEHVNRYAHVAEAMVKAEYAFTGFDLRGHGRSEGQRGHTPHGDSYFKDMDAFISQIEDRYPGIPKFLYGHSLGGVLVLGYTPIRHPLLAGVVSTATSSNTSLQEQSFKVFLAKFLGTIAPKMVMSSGLVPTTLSRDPEVIDTYIADSLVHNKVTTGWGKNFLAVVEKMKKLAPQFPVPVLLMHGSEDKLSFPKGSLEWASLAPKDLTTVKLWDGLFHEIHNEPEKGKVFEYMIQWLDEHLKKA
jgi:acylglycerol lipase